MEELKKKLEELQNREFMLQMKDYWARDDYDLDRKLRAEIREIENKIKEMAI